MLHTTCLLLLSVLSPGRSQPGVESQSGAQSSTSVDAPIVQRLDTLFEHCANFGMLNGVVLVKAGGRTLYTRAFGVADPSSERPLDVDSAFYLASVSKQFTAMAAMILAEADVLSLEDALTDYFPEFAGFASAVRLHHLMTHTSGIPDHFKLLEGGPAGLTNERVRSLLVDHGRLEFAPGSRYAYSNGGYVLLSMVIAKAAGTSYREVLEERVFGPLGMEHTLVYDQTEPVVANRAHGFRMDGTLDDYQLFTTGAGGMFSTVGDLDRWDAALFEGELVSAAMLERAYTPPGLDGGQRTHYGFGWFVASHAGQRFASHSGGLAGFATYIIRNLDTRDALVVLSNQAESVISFDTLTDSVGAILAGVEPSLPRVPVGPYVQQLIAAEGLERALARYDELRENADPAFDLGESQLNNAGYAFLQRDELEIALALFSRNTEAFPDAFNTWDSLAEAQALLGRNAEAIANYERSLELNPENDNAVRALALLRAKVD